MFKEIFLFECRFQLRSPLFGVVAAVFALLGFLIMGTESVSVGGVGNNLNLVHHQITIPEPSSLLLVMLGVVPVGVRSRRSRVVCRSGAVYGVRGPGDP